MNNRAPRLNAQPTQDLKKGALVHVDEGVVYQSYVTAWRGWSS
jgi:hypothetical protein